MRGPYLLLYVCTVETPELVNLLKAPEKLLSRMATSVSFEVFIYLQAHVTAGCWGGVQRKGVLWMGYRFQAFRFSHPKIAVQQG